MLGVREIDILNGARIGLSEHCGALLNENWKSLEVSGRGWEDVARGRRNKFVRMAMTNHYRGSYPYTLANKMRTSK